MDLRQLNALTAVADHRSFSAAARALHTVQSNVSTHVARLERELGAELVDRRTGTLTEAGEIAVARARRVQAEVDALQADVAAASGELAGPVRLGVIGTTARWLVPRLLDEVHRRHPLVRVVVVDASTTSLVPQLATRALDLAVVNLPVHDPDVDVDLLFEEEHVLLVGRDHPFAGAEVLDLADLDGVPLLMEPHGTGFRDDLEADAARKGITLTAQAEVDGMRLLASLAYVLHGIAILPASAVVEWSDGTAVSIPLTGTTPRTVGLASSRRERLSAPASAVADILRAVVAGAVPERAGLRLLPTADGAERVDGAGKGEA